MFKKTGHLVSASLFVIVMMGAAGSAMAQATPHSVVASPDIYKVIEESEQFRVVEVTWKPGQRDKIHSHPASAVYYPMDCTLRAYGPTGVVMGEKLNKAGSAVIQRPINAHSVENIGQSECKLIMFEQK